MADVQMPQLGETVTEGTITRWFKQVGDAVSEDEPLFEVSTDKVDSEVPSPVSGTVSEILVDEGDTVEVGALLARIGDGSGASTPREDAAAPEPEADEPAPEPEPESPPAPRTGAQQQPARETSPAPSAGKQNGEADSDDASRSKLLSPVVRKLVNDNDLDVAAITGTGPGGRITRDDVLDAIDAGTAKATPRREAPAPGAGQAPPQASAPAQAVRAGERDTVVPHTRIRRSTAEHMRRSVDTAAHVYASIEVDFEAVERVRRAHKDAFRAEEGFGLTYLPFISRAVADAIRDYPHVNASFGSEELVVHNYLNLGVAVDLDFQGLLVPVVVDADGLRLRAIARSVNDLASRARSKKLSPDELAGGTFTITNPGPYGTTITMPIINQPQVAILSTDGVKRRPVVVEDADGGESIAIHSVGNLTLTWDHRAFDGAYAAAFLKRAKDLIETMDWEQELS